MKPLKLEGINSYFALQAYGKLMLGLKMLPMYMGEDYADFFKKVEAMPPADQEKVIREAVFLVDLHSEEVVNLARFCADANGVPFDDANMKKLPPDQIMEILVTVCLECAKIKPKLLTEAEKKN